MNTTNELPPPALEEKIDRLAALVQTILERMEKQDEDSRLRYVDLRQRIEKQDERLSRMEETFDRQDKRQDRMEQRLYTLDRNIDAFLREMLYVKDRVNEIEATRELRH